MAGQTAGNNFYALIALILVVLVICIIDASLNDSAAATLTRLVVAGQTGLIYSIVLAGEADVIVPIGI